MSHWRDLASWQADAAAARASDHVLQLDGRVRPGLCDLCGSTRGFSPASGPADAREGLQCLSCGCNARQRAAGRLLLEHLAAHTQARIHLTEQASRLYLAVRRRFPRTSGAEFIGSWRKRLRLSFWLWRKGVFEIVRHGDVTASGSADGALDAVLSLDVLEHVPNARSAFSELARVIRPGGVLVATIPFYDDALQSTQIATLSASGAVEFVGEPEYHGDPLGSGVPCFHHFGWAVLQDLRDAGFSDAAAHRVSDATRGLPHGIWVIVANR